MQLAPLPVVNAPRRKPGRGSQVTLAERRQIQRLHLAEGLSRKQIAARVGRTRETIAAQLRDDDFQALKRELNAEMAEEARTTLKSHVRSAATYWVKAAAVAAKRGDHRPARDLLLHAGVITRLGDTVGPQMQVVIGMPGHPAIEPPSQEAIDAAIAREEAAARDTIDMVRVPPRELGMPPK